MRLAKDSKSSASTPPPRASKRLSPLTHHPATSGNPPFSVRSDAYVATDLLMPDRERNREMPLCFIEPEQAIRVVAESIGGEPRRQLLGEIVHAWVDEIPEDELVVHYAKAVEDLDEDDLSMLAAWHASLEVGQPVANKEFPL